MLRKSFLALSVVLALSGCGGSSSSHSIVPNLSVSADITSISRNLKTYQGGVVTAGWNQLTGTTTVNGSAATVELLADVNYRNGSGEFGGFLTVTLADDSAITFKMDGQAKLNSTTNTTTFFSNLTLVGGSGQYASSSAVGTFTGSRTTELGGAVHVDIELEVH